MSEQHLPSVLLPFQNFINFSYTSFWLISLVTYSLAVLYFVLFEADTFVEYAESAFYTFVTFLHVVSYVILVQKRSKLFGLLRDSDAMVQKSKTHWNIIFQVRIFNLFSNFRRVQRSCDSAHLRSRERKNDRIVHNTLKLGVYICRNIFVSECCLFVLEILYNRFWWRFIQFAISIEVKHTFFSTHHKHKYLLKHISFRRIPWYWKTPSGYFACVCVQYVWIHCGIFSVICTLPLIAGFCSLFGAFILDINKTLTDFNGQITSVRDQLTANKRIKLYRKLTEIASFHSNAKELVWFTPKICSIFIIFH